MHLCTPLCDHFDLCNYFDAQFDICSTFGITSDFFSFFFLILLSLTYFPIFFKILDAVCCKVKFLEAT
jgi:hypothetical protein